MELGINVGHYPTARMHVVERLLKQIGARAVRWMNWLRPMYYAGTWPLTVAHDWEYAGGPWDKWTGHVPLTLIIDVANRLGVDSYINLPYATCAPAMAMVCDLLAARHKGRWTITVGNEVWNSVYSVQQARLAHRSEQDALYPHLSGYAAAIRDLHAANRGRGRLAIESQAYEPRLTRYLLDDCGLSGFVDAVAIAPYFGRGVLSGHESQAQLQGWIQGDLTKLEALVAAHGKMAQAAGAELIAYEAGLHFAGESPALEQMARRGAAAWYYAQCLSLWRVAGGGDLFWYRLNHAAQQPVREHWQFYEVAGETAKRYLVGVGV